MITYHNKLSLTPGEPPVIINLHQNDSNYYLRFEFYSNNGVHAGDMHPTQTAKIKGTLPDGTVYEKEGTIIGEEPYSESEIFVVFSGDSNLTATPGICNFEIKIGTNLAYFTANFYVVIEPLIFDMPESDSIIREIHSVSIDTSALNNAVNISESAENRILELLEIVEELGG